MWLSVAPVRRQFGGVTRLVSVIGDRLDWKMEIGCYPEGQAYGVGKTEIGRENREQLIRYKHQETRYSPR